VKVQFREFPRGEHGEAAEAPLGIRITTAIGIFDIHEHDGVVRLRTPHGLLTILPDAMNSVMLRERDHNA
jgi:hypothetical protein